MNRSKSAFVAVLSILALLWSWPPARAQEVSGPLSNFDVRNLDQARKFDDFELMLLGKIEPGCIEGWYPGWGMPAAVSPGTPFGPGLTVTWRNARDPIEPGRSEHFGLRLRCDGPFTARGFWSVDGRPVREVALPWQSWQAHPGFLRDVIQLPDRLDTGSVTVVREAVTLPEPLSLEQLNWDSVEQRVRRLGRQWRRFDRLPRPLTAGERAVLQIPVKPEDGAAIVRYTVTERGRTVSRFVNQARLIWRADCPAGLPDPQIEVTGSESYIGSDGKPYTRYRVAVTNRTAYPDSLFAAAPDLPPCGLNTSSSRTWVDLNDGNGARRYGFCALSGAADLADLWFAMPRGTPPPACISVTLTDRRCERVYASSCAPTSGFGPACIDFESLPRGSTYTVGNVFTDAGATMIVKPFQRSNATSTSDGRADVSRAGKAGVAGQEIWTNNANLDFHFPALPNVLFLNFGAYGGNLNLEVNGDFRNFQSFADVSSAIIGGAQVAVTHGRGDGQGTLKLTGEIHSFAIGGQELALDHVCVTEQPPVDLAGTWIMPFAVGGTRLDGIKATGLTDYIDGISGFAMSDAPFGGHLGFRLGAAGLIPTPDIYYYRIQYRHELEATWHDFEETVAAHYVREAPRVPPVFPTLVLGPHDVNGKKLFRFRPHEEELPSLVPVAPGETVSWPSTGFLGDIYAGYLNTAALSLLPGRYVIRIEIYDSKGNQKLPPGAFRFIVPIGTAPDGTLVTGSAPGTSVSNGGFELSLHIDNRPTSALIDKPTIGGKGPEEGCGFLRYAPAEPPLAKPVQVRFHATHPDGRALFTFRIVRAHTEVTLANLIGQEVSALAAGTPGVFGVSYLGDGSGNFSRSFSRGELLMDCTEAAFSQNLDVYAKATTGWQQRIPSLDSLDVFAFALAPE